MDKVTTSLPIIPLRAEPSHRSEMVSQVLFGEELVVLLSQGEFIQVRMQETAYEGWVQQSQVSPFIGQHATVAQRIVGLDPVYVTDGKHKRMLLHTTPIHAPQIQMGDILFRFEGALREPS